MLARLVLGRSETWLGKLRAHPVRWMSLCHPLSAPAEATWGTHKVKRYNGGLGVLQSSERSGQAVDGDTWAGSMDVGQVDKIVNLHLLPGNVCWPAAVGG